jgi:hypothetical protein
MFLRCVHCGKRTSGWAVEARFHQTAPRLPVAPPVVTTPARILPFDRAAAS